MSRQVRRSLALALAGLLGGLGLVLAFFGDGLRLPSIRQEAGPPVAPAPEAGARTLAGPSADAPARAKAPAGGAGQDEVGKGSEGKGAQGKGARGEGARGEGGIASDGRAAGTAARGGRPGESPSAGDKSGPAAPSFDIVRVEPNGDAVVAGRGAPNTVVEMLVDGKPVARALADPNGQFAIVPPALPAGSSQIQLRTKAADGRESRSAQTVAVDVAQGRDRRPLVALTAPDKPTVVLSQPGVPEAPPATQAGRPDGTGNPDTKTADAKNPAEKAAGRTQPARIVSVDAQEGGRLYVTAPGVPAAVT